MSIDSSSSISPHKRKYEQHSDKLHELVIEYHRGGLNYTQIAAALHLPRATAKSIIRSFIHDPTHIHKKKSGGNHHSTVSDAVKQEICDLQTQHNEWRLIDIQQALHTSSPPSLPHISRTLKQADFTTKHLQPIANGRITRETLSKRKNWVETVAP